MALRKVIIIVLLSLAGLSACASSYRPPQFPLRDADLYPNSQSIAGLSIAVDEISDPDRVKQYFGVDLTSEGILPVNIIITNHGDDRFFVKPSDVLLLLGNNVIDPLPIDSVEKSVKGGRRRMVNLPLQETVVAPQGNYQGLLFFKTPKQDTGLFGKEESFFADKLTMRIVAADRDSGERFLFGPYPLSGL